MHPSPAERNGYRRAWLAGSIFLLVYAALAIVKYASFHSGIDLGLFTQAISSGDPHLPDAIEGGSHFAFHFSPVLFVCVPVLAFARTPLALQIVQAFAGALVAPAVYRIAARTLPPRTALTLACAALAYPPLAAVTFVDFHENGFVAPVVLWLAAAVLERRLLLAAALAVVLLSIKEDEAPILAFAATCTGLWALRAGERRLATSCAAAVAVCVVVFVGYFAWLQPLASGGRAWSPLHFYAPSGRGVAAVVPYASPQRLGYVLEALYPLLFLPLCSPRAIFALPGLLEDVLSRQSLPFSMDSHYPAVWLPWMLLAAVDGVSCVVRRTRRSPATAVLAVSAAVLVVASPTHWRSNLSWPSSHDALLERAVASVPANVPLGTQDEIFSHLGFSRTAQVGPERPVRDPELVLVDTTRADASYFVPRLVRAVAGRGSGYELVERRDGIALYRRSRV